MVVNLSDPYGGRRLSGMATVTAITKEMTFDFDGLIQLLAGYLYAEKKVFIRELIQNAHDAIQRRIADDPAFDRDQGHIDIITDLSGTGRIIFRDNGIGMTEDDLVTFLSTIGKSGTQEARAAAAENDNALADVIGQFGIGFLSGFVVGQRVEVRTRHWQAAETQGCHWENSGRADYTITPANLSQVGTEVIVHLASAEHRGLLHEDAVKKVIREYADMLRIAIHLNDPNHHRPPVNTRVMPWERPGLSEEELRIDAIVYLEKTVPDSVLEIIPIRIDDPARDGAPALWAEGLLYITRTRVLGRDAPRTVRVFLKRMFVCEEAKDALPPWATFINGIINTRSLSPNAARDNFTYDEAFTRLQDRLGDLIVSHFERLRETDPQRLSEILAYHHLGIQAACHYYEPFFHKFGHLLEWRINANAPAARSANKPSVRRLLGDELGANHASATLPEVLASLPAPPGGGPKKLPCFTTHSSANQLFEMADAAGTTVLDAGYPFGSELLQAWADRNRDTVVLVYVDREDDPEVFRETDPTQDRAVMQLARLMSMSIRTSGSGQVRVEARRFEPASLPAILKSSEASSAMKARSILSDPNSSSSVRAIAEDLLRMMRITDMRMNINALNPLIRALADLLVANPQDSDLAQIMMCVYNDAILYNSELMTPSNAQKFHRQFQWLMVRLIDFVKHKDDLAHEREALDRQRAAFEPEDDGRRRRRHFAGFLMTPFSADFAVAREAVRSVVEDRFGCELRIASDRTFEHFIRGNVEAHMDDADFFIADVTGANPNVMMELGAAYHSRKPKPVLLIARIARDGDKPDLPADLAGHLAVTYVAGRDVADVATVLEEGFRKHARLETLLKEAAQERFISAESLRFWTRNVLQDNGTYERLSEVYPTVSAWRAVTATDLPSHLGEEADLAAVVLKRITDNLATL